MNISNIQDPKSNVQTRVRFAPSPTGNLHIGSARTALFNWLFAKNNKGTFVLRIEDTDRARSTKEYEKSILDDMSWLGLDFDEGPGKGNFGPYHQSKRFDLYKEKVNKLIKEGKAYNCYCSIEQLQTEKKKALVEGRPPRYSGRCRKLAEKELSVLKDEGIKPSVRFAVRKDVLKVDDLIYGQISFDLEEISDFVIQRADGSSTFHLAVVVDDGEMKISHVIRGEDHLSNTPKHILLFDALGYQQPTFAHIPIILGPDKTKLSKRHRAAAISEYRENGFLPEAMVNYLSLLSWSPPQEQEVLSREELISFFEISSVSKSPAIFDIGKLKWLNGQHIRRLSDEELAQQIKPLLESKKMITGNNKLKLIASAIKDDLITITEAPDYANVFFQEEINFNKEAKKYLKEDLARQAILSFKDLFEKSPSQNLEEAKELLKQHSKKLKEQGIKGKNAFMPIRLALIGSYSGPELFYLISILENEKVMNRLNQALNLV